MSVFPKRVTIVSMSLSGFFIIHVCRSLCVIFSLLSWGVLGATLSLSGNGCWNLAEQVQLGVYFAAGLHLRFQGCMISAERQLVL